MFLSINWLKDFILFDLSPETLAEKLIMAGIEVEQISHIGGEWKNIVVGEILDIKPHPQADKLSLTRVQAGEQDRFSCLRRIKYNDRPESAPGSGGSRSAERHADKGSKNPG